MKGGLKRDSVQKLKMYLENLERPVVLSALFYRDYTCPQGCGGCCPRFTLDFVDGSERWDKFKNTYPESLKHFKKRTVDGVDFWTDSQEDNQDHYCRNLDKSNGRCNIHQANPFSCEFELMKLGTLSTKKEVRTILINKLFGRGWSYKRVDGKKGALCEMLGFSFPKFLRDLNLLKELHQIALLFGSKGNLPAIINYLDQNTARFEKGDIPTKNIEFDTNKKTENQTNLWT